jgi:ligand-binding sensor domain-containing protein
MRDRIRHFIYIAYSYLLWLLLLTYAPVSAQHPYFYNLNNETGLPSNEVYQVAQDSFGSIWIACDAGLYMYNGVRFTPYTNSRQNSKSISNIIIDKHQNVWSQNFTGQIFRVSPGSDSLTIIYNDNRYSKTFPSFTIDNLDRVWIAADSVIVLMDANGNMIKELPMSKMGIGAGTWADIRSANDKIYVSNYECSYWIIDTKDLSFKQFPSNRQRASNKLIYSNGRMFQYIESYPERKYQVIDITKGQGVLLAEFKPPTPSTQYYTITGIGDGLMLCSSSGAQLLEHDLAENKEHELFFPGKKISNCFVDREKNYWFTSLQDGIFISPSPDVTVFNRSNSLLSDDNISAMEKISDNELLLGTYSGELYSLDVSDRKLELASGNKESKYRAVKKIKAVGDKTYAARGRFTIEEHGKTITVEELNNTRDFTITGDTIFYTTSHSTGFVVHNEGKWVRTSLREKGGKKIARDSRQHTVYFACTDGLFAYSNGKMERIKAGNEDIFASCLLFEQDTLWIGTNNNGILALSNGRPVLSITAPGMLRDNNIKSLYHNGNKLYAATSTGINILEGKTSSFINEYDGLACKEVNDLQLLNGQLFVATISGLVSMPATVAHTNSTPPSIKIISARKNKQLINISNGIELNYNDNNLTIEFVGAAFRSRGAFTYRYRLSGFDEEWHYTTSNNPFVNYSSLPAGTYTFQVVTVNEDGLASAAPAILSIVVTSPAWKQWWFYLIILCLALGVAFLAFKVRLGYIKRKAEERNKLIASQLTALKAQMNPHFMYNALNSIQAFIINNDVKNSNLYLNKFSKLMRKVLDASDMELISLQDEIDILELYLDLEKFRFGSDFEYEIIIGENIDPHRTMLPSMILQPFIENSIKHGLLHKKGAKHLVIQFSLDDMLHCVITDNGVGRKRSEEIKQRSQQAHRSFATGATEKRIELLNSYMSNRYSFQITDLYKDGLPSGTSVTVHIPF